MGGRISIPRSHVLALFSVLGPEDHPHPGLLVKEICVLEIDTVVFLKKKNYAFLLCPVVVFSQDEAFI